MVNNVKQGILVVTANYRKAYPILKSVSKMGLKTIALFHTWRSPVFSKYVSKRYFVANPYSDEKKYIAELISIVNKEEPLMIIPVGYIDTILISKYRKLLPRNVIIPVPDYETLIKVSRKDLIIKLCDRLGIRYPQTYVVPEISMPAVVKSVYDSSKPKYVFLRETLNEIVSAKKCDVLIQEFIPGIGCGYFALAKDGNVIVDYTHVRIIEKKPSGGPSIFSCLDFNPELLLLGRKIVKELKWTGVIMVEFRRNMETGEYYLLEINPKFWGSLELATSLGIDIPRYLVEVFLFNKKPKPLVRMRRKRCFAWMLSGLYYLKQNPKVWLKMLKEGLSTGFLQTDVHLNDPPELLYSILTMFTSVFTRKHPALKINIKGIYRASLMYLRKTLQEKNIECIVFDLDGTLTKLNIPWSEVKNKLVSKRLIKPWNSIMMSLYKSKGKNVYHEVNQIVKAYEEKSVEKIRGDNELYFLLKELSLMINYLAVVSKQEKHTVESILSKMGVLDRFSVIVGRETEILRLKQLKEVVKRLKISPEKTLVLGDTIVDISSAVRLNMIPIGVTDNPYRFQQFIEYGIPCFKNVKEALRYIILQKRYYS